MVAEMSAACAAKDEHLISYARISAVFSKYQDDNALFIRPSGNPMTAEQAKTMYAKEDLESQSMELVSVDSLRVFADGNAAVATYTAHEKFSYQGTPVSQAAPCNHQCCVPA